MRNLATLFGALLTYNLLGCSALPTSEKQVLPSQQASSQTSNTSLNQAAKSTTSQTTQAVPYYFQYDNAKEGHRACNITSIAMVMDFFQIPKSDPSITRTPDYLYQRFGIKQQPQELANIFNTVAKEQQVAVEDQLFLNGTFEQLQEHVKNGFPAVVHGWFTASGHIVVVTGYDGEYYEVNDPAGRWNLKKYAAGQYDNSISGEGVRYPAKAFEYAINDNGTGDDLWLHLFTPIQQK